MLLLSTVVLNVEIDMKKYGFQNFHAQVLKKTALVLLCNTVPLLNMVKNQTS